MATKNAVKKTRVTRAQVNEHRTNSKRDMSPKWDGCETWDADKFHRHFVNSMTWYRLESSGKDLKPQVINWMARNDFTKSQIAEFKKTKDNRCGTTMGAIAACLLKGMPEVRADFNEGRDTAKWLKEAIAKTVSEGKDDIDEEAVKAAEAEKPAVYVPTIQERLREAAGQMTDELEEAIDAYITDPEAFDPKAFKVASLLRSKGVKPAHARLIKTFYEQTVAEYEELQSKDCEEQLAEAYNHYGKKNIRKMVDFLASVMSACDQIIGEAKLNKKPRAKKVKPAEELVKKVKFKATDDRYGITSIPAAQIIGAQQVVVFNTKTRKLGIYTSKTSEGLAVKGASIVNFTDKSVQKTLRKPELQLKEFKDLNTARRAQAWLDNIKAVGTLMNGRINAEIMILKAWK
jgi:hypothetical protein